MYITHCSAMIGNILERLLARSATEAVRWTGAGRLCGRGRGRSETVVVVVSTVYLGSQSQSLACLLACFSRHQTSSVGLL